MYFTEDINKDLGKDEMEIHIDRKIRMNEEKGYIENKEIGQKTSKEFGKYKKRHVESEATYHTLIPSLKMSWNATTIVPSDCPVLVGNGTETSNFCDLSDLTFEPLEAVSFLPQGHAALLSVDLRIHELYHEAYCKEESSG
ncbi:Caskin-1 [Manis pentadactyla]|nr:Caskin-1 [Manis pentadactyla]